jgi:hypothetical protein
MQGCQEELLSPERQSAAASLIAEVLQQFGRVQLRAYGVSMFPIIRSGDVLSVARCLPGELEHGDVILARDGSQLFAHRVISTSIAADGAWIATRGDSHWRRAPWLPGTSVLGRVVAVMREGRAIDGPFPCSSADRARGLALSEWTRIRRRIRAMVKHVRPRPGAISR